MEIGLGVGKWEPHKSGFYVLILVLVEIGLGDTIEGLIVLFKEVLILVLVEIGLGGERKTVNKKWFGISLNPCFSGNRFGRV